MNDLQWRLLVFLCGAVITIGGVSLITQVLRTEPQSPSETFTAQVQALADEDYQTAHDLLASDCEITKDEVEVAFTEQPIDSRDWGIRKAFMGDDEALLYFYGPENVVQRLIKEDGDWLLSCELP